MRHFLFVLIAVAFFLPSTHAGNDFDPEFCWEEMHYLAQSRVKWFRESCDSLSNNNKPLDERVALAKKILPDDVSSIHVPRGLSAPKQKEIQKKKYIEAVLSDLLFGCLYWDFLERTLSFYSPTSGKVEDLRQTVLPHLAAEIAHFDEYAIGDLLSNSHLSYNLEEFFRNRTIYDLAEKLAQHYQLELPTLALFVDQKTHEVVPLSELNSPSINLVSAKPSYQASPKLLYFMEQILNERRTKNSKQANEHLPPDMQAPKMKGFQAYILPVSGPAFVQEIKEEPLSKKPSQAPKPPKEKMANKKKKKKKATFSSSAAPLPAPLEKNSKEEITSPSSSTPTTSLPVASASENLTLRDTLVLSLDQKDSPQPTPLPMKKVALSRPLQRLNLRDITFQIEHRSVPAYMFQNTPFSLPLFEEATPYFDPSFLKKVKVATHTSPNTDRVPNIAKGCLRLHFEVQGKDKDFTIPLHELFLSGGKFFDKKDLQFKKQHWLVNAFHDFLTPEEEKKIHNLPIDKKGIPLGIAMEMKIRRDIISGPWRRNCLDSEALLLLRARENLPQVLRNLVKQEGPLTLKGIVLGISSYRDPCPSCEHLIQGFQGVLPHIISSLHLPELTLDPNFGSLALALGHTRNLENKPVKRLTTPATLASKQNPLVCIRKGK